MRKLVLNAIAAICLAGITIPEQAHAVRPTTAVHRANQVRVSSSRAGLVKTEALRAKLADADYKYEQQLAKWKHKQALRRMKQLKKERKKKAAIRAKKRAEYAKRQKQLKKKRDAERKRMLAEQQRKEKEKKLAENPEASKSRNRFRNGGSGGFLDKLRVAFSGVEEPKM